MKNQKKKTWTPEQVVELLKKKLTHRQIREKIGAPLSSISRIRNNSDVPEKTDDVKVAVIWTDTHVKEHDRRAFHVMAQIAQKAGATIMADLGDIVNADGISKYAHGRMEKGVYETGRELDYYKKHIHDPLVKLLNPERVIMCGGNHCTERIAELRRKLTARNEEPELIEHFMEILSMNKRFPSAERCEWNDGIELGKLFLTHGFYYGANHARQTALNFLCNVVYGHTHASQTCTINNRKDKQPHKAVGLGCMCKMNPTYKKNAPNSWVNTFAIAYILPSGDYQLYEVNIINGKAVWNGEVYKGEDKELSQLIK